MYKTICKTLWFDEAGAILCAELVLVMTLLMCACVVGISSLRNAIATELADLAGALGVLNQSYSVGGIMSYHAWQPGNVFVDRLDSGDLLAADGADGVIICAAVCGNEAGLISHQGAATGQLLTAPPRPDVHPSPPCPPPIAASSGASMPAGRDPVSAGRPSVWLHSRTPRAGWQLLSRMPEAGSPPN